MASDPALDPPLTEGERAAVIAYSAADEYRPKLEALHAMVAAIRAAHEERVLREVEARIARAVRTAVLEDPVRTFSTTEQYLDWINAALRGTEGANG